MILISVFVFVVFIILDYRIKKNRFQYFKRFSEKKKRREERIEEKNVEINPTYAFIDCHLASSCLLRSNY
jgi:hypothetical protein